jgi:uncharacterized SAM-binding protein YcdF (DUF218 family)
MVSVANMNTGIFLVAVCGLVFLLYGILFTRLRKVRLLNGILTGGILLGCLLIVFLMVYGRSSTVTYKEDALVVLGAAIKGETPAYPLYARLEAAIAYHRQNPEAIIVVSGGQGYQEDITEALAMERHLIRRGIPKEIIQKEERATSTYENFQYSKELLDNHFNGPYTVAFVTSDFHIFRALLTAKSLGLRPTHIAAPILWYTMPTNYFRECAAVAKEVLTGILRAIM